MIYWRYVLGKSNTLTSRSKGSTIRASSSGCRPDCLSVLLHSSSVITHSIASFNFPTVARIRFSNDRPFVPGVVFCLSYIHCIFLSSTTVSAVKPIPRTSPANLRPSAQKHATSLWQLASRHAFTSSSSRVPSPPSYDNISNSSCMNVRVPYELCRPPLKVKFCPRSFRLGSSTSC